MPNEPKPGAGGLIRQARKSKQKGPKRLVKDGPLKTKDKKEIVIDEEEDIEGKILIFKIESLIDVFIATDIPLTEGSFTLRTNTKSVRTNVVFYWFNCLLFYADKLLEILHEESFGFITKTSIKSP